MDDRTRIAATRQAEKVDEFLFEAYERFQDGETEDGLSLLLAANGLYGAQYNAIRVTLRNAERKRLLPLGFIIPDTIEEFREMYAIDDN